MNWKKSDPDKTLTIVIGGDSDADDRELLENPEKGMKQPRHIIYLNSYEQLQRILSPAKLDLLRSLFDYDPHSKGKNVGEIAQRTKRKQEAISRDLHDLEKQKFVKLIKNGRNVFAHANFDTIEIKMQG